MKNAKKKTINPEKGIKKYAVGGIILAVAQVAKALGDQVSKKMDAETSEMVAQNQMNKNTQPYGSMHTDPLKDQIMAMGGKMGMGVAKVEKDEIVQTPAGETMKVGGGTHASGNDTTIVAPAGTEVYSAQVKVDGKTMAKHKEERMEREAKRMKRLDKLVEKNEKRMGDAPTERTLKSAILSMEAEAKMDAMTEQAHMEIQQSFQNVQDAEMRNGGRIKSYAAGGTIEPNWNDMSGDKIKQFQKWYNSTMGGTLKVDGIAGPLTSEALKTSMDQFTANQKTLNAPVGGIDPGISPNTRMEKTGQEIQDEKNSLLNALKPKKPEWTTTPWESHQKAANASMTEADFAAEDARMQSDMAELEAGPVRAKRPGEKAKGFGFDSVNHDVAEAGITDPKSSSFDLGQTLAVGAPMILTALNRIGDTTIPNFYKNVADDALDTNQRAIQANQSALDETVSAQKLSLNGLLETIRSGTRSPQTGRGLSMAAVAQSDRVEAETRAKFAQQGSSLLDRRSQIQLDAGKSSAEGERMAKQQNDANRDNFFTQLNRDVTNVSKNLQKIKNNKKMRDFIETEKGKEMLEAMGLFNQLMSINPKG